MALLFGPLASRPGSYCPPLGGRSEVVKSLLASGQVTSITSPETNMYALYSSFLILKFSFESQGEEPADLAGSVCLTMICLRGSTGHKRQQSCHPEELTLQSLTPVSLPFEHIFSPRRPKGCSNPVPALRPRLSPRLYPNSGGAQPSRGIRNPSRLRITATLPGQLRLGECFPQGASVRTVRMRPLLIADRSATSPSMADGCF